VDKALADKTPGVILLGAGGHARVVADALARLGFAVAGMVAPGIPPGSVLDLALLGDDGDLGTLARAGFVRAALGIGDNERRRAASEAARAEGIQLLQVLHPGAILAADTQIEDGVVVLAGAVVNAGARLGRGAVVNSLGLVEHDAEVGAFAHVAPGARLLGAAALGASSLLGAGATVLPGIAVGSGATVGAGAVVTRDVAPGATVVGVPARPLAHPVKR
jgi:UDP-perosamine 4-acetyltransferase